MQNFDPNFGKITYVICFLIQCNKVLAICSGIADSDHVCHVRPNKRIENGKHNEICEAYRNQTYGQSERWLLPLSTIPPEDHVSDEVDGEKDESAASCHHEALSDCQLVAGDVVAEPLLPLGSLVRGRLVLLRTRALHDS